MSTTLELENALSARAEGVQNFSEETQVALLLHDLKLSHAQAALKLSQELNFAISPKTIELVLSGDARQSMITLIRYALERQLDESGHPSDISPDYQGSTTYSPDAETEYHTHFISAESEQEAIDKLVALGFNLSPSRNETDYDCTGEWYRSPPFSEYMNGRGCYAVTTRYHRDV